MTLGRPPKYNSVEELEDLIEEYFDTDAYMGEGDNRVFAPTISGLAYHLDMTTESLRRYEKKDDFCATIKAAKQRVERALEQRLYGQNVTGTIFNLKNNFGWKDKIEQELTGKDGGPIQTSWTILPVAPNATDPDS